MAFKRIIAVDFDNTLSLNNRWLYIGEPNLPLISFLHDAQAKGYGVVLKIINDIFYDVSNSPLHRNK